MLGTPGPLASSHFVAPGVSPDGDGPQAELALLTVLPRADGRRLATSLDVAFGPKFDGDGERSSSQGDAGGRDEQTKQRKEAVPDVHTPQDARRWLRRQRCAPA